jgi:hypothetical protein
MKQLDLFGQEIPEWLKRGFKTRSEWEKAKEYDRAFRHAKQMEKARKKNEIKD